MSLDGSGSAGVHDTVAIITALCRGSMIATVVGVGGSEVGEVKLGIVERSAFMVELERSLVGVVLVLVLRLCPSIGVRGAACSSHREVFLQVSCQVGGGVVSSEGPGVWGVVGDEVVSIVGPWSVRW